MQDNIPTIQPVSKKAVFTVQDVTNSFEKAIKDKHAQNWQAYLNAQQAKRV